MSHEPRRLDQVPLNTRCRSTQGAVEYLEVRVVDELKYQGRRLRLQPGVRTRVLPFSNRHTIGSRTTSSNWMMLVPPLRFWSTLISRLIFFFLTGWQGRSGKYS